MSGNTVTGVLTPFEGSSRVHPLPAQFKAVKTSGYLYLTLPYIATMILLILTSKRSQAPKAQGIPCHKGGR